VVRIAFTSDLHIDITPQNRGLLPYLLGRVEELRPHVLVLAGDLGNDLSAWREALQQFQSLSIVKMVVPGNHDVWMESKRALKRTQDSAWKYNHALPASAEEFGFHYLPTKPVVFGEVGFVGSLGWYDYSIRDQRLDGVISLSVYEKGEFSAGSWNDVRYAAWLRYPASDNWRQRKLRITDAEVCQSMQDSLNRDLASFRESVDRIVAVVHTCPFESCIERTTLPDPFDAYEGSSGIGEILTRYSGRHKIVTICGHRHRYLDIVENGVRVVRRPVGYLKGFDGDYRQKANEVVGLLEV
jgi:predicted phosphohydrolase